LAGEQEGTLSGFFLTTKIRRLRVCLTHPNIPMCLVNIPDLPYE
jgi:hypothetical protein